jgi:hypothetical protein
MSRCVSLVVLVVVLGCSLTRPGCVVGVGVAAALVNIPVPGGAGISYQDGVLRIRLGGTRAARASSYVVPPLDTLPPATSVTVRDTGTGRGFGAFALEGLNEGTFLGFYEGTVVRSREDLDRLMVERERDIQTQNLLRDDDDDDMGTMGAAGDYVLSLDGGATFLDGYERARDRSRFSPVHLNHANGDTTECNCVRVFVRHQNDDDSGRYSVAFFTCRNVQANEELRFDYGSNFWKGREGQKVE